MELPLVSRIAPRIGMATTALLAVLAAYGVFSTPALITQWGASVPGVALLAGWIAAVWLVVPLGRAKPSRLLLIGLAVIAIALRGLVAAWFIGRGASGDAMMYPRIVQTMLDGHGLNVFEPYIGSTLYALYPPVYPLLLAGWTAVAGASVPSMLVLNGLTDVATAGMICALARTLGRPVAGRAGAWLYLIWPSVLLSAPLAAKEGLCALLVVALATAWCAAIKPDAARWKPAMAIGMTTGLLALTQPGEGPLALLFGLALVPLASFRGVVVTGLRALPIAMLVMLPWWVRNWLIFGAFVPLTSAGPVSLWVGNNPDATGNWIPTPPALKGESELDYARRTGALAKAWIAGHPVEFVTLTATKFVRALGVGQFGVQRLSHETPMPGRTGTGLFFPLAQLSHLMLLGGSALALGLRGRRIAPAMILLVLAGFAQMVLFGMWFEFGERHREFLTPLLLLAVAMAVVGGEAAEK